MKVVERAIENSKSEWLSPWFLCLVEVPLMVIAMVSMPG